MITLYAEEDLKLEDLKKLVDDPRYSIQDDPVREIPYARSLCEKLTNYALPPDKFSVVSKESPKLDIALREQIKTKELTWDVLYDSLLYGGGAEFIHLNTKDASKIKAKKINPLSLIVIKESDYDDPHTVLFWEYLPTKDIKTKDEQTFFDDKKVWIDNGSVQMVFEKGILIEEIKHGLGIPAINVLAPFRGDPFYKSQIDLIKQLESSYRYLYKETRKTLNILIAPNKLKEPIKDSGKLQVIEGVQTEDGEPKLLIRSPEYEGVFRYIELLEKRISKETGVVDFSSQENANQDASGEALKLRLISIEDKCSAIYGELREFLQNRNLIISRLLKFPYTETNTVITLKTNQPVNELARAQTYNMYLGMGICSLTTAQEKLGFDPEDEKKLFKKEDRLNEVGEAHIGEETPSLL